MRNATERERKMRVRNGLVPRSKNDQACSNWKEKAVLRG